MKDSRELAVERCVIRAVRHIDKPYTRELKSYPLAQAFGWVDTAIGPKLTLRDTDEREIIGTFLDARISEVGVRSEKGH